MRTWELFWLSVIMRCRDKQSFVECCVGRRQTRTVYMHVIVSSFPALIYNVWDSSVLLLLRTIAFSFLLCSFVKHLRNKERNIKKDTQSHHTIRIAYPASLKCEDSFSFFLILSWFLVGRNRLLVEVLSKRMQSPDSHGVLYQTKPYIAVPNLLALGSLFVFIEHKLV